MISGLYIGANFVPCTNKSIGISDFFERTNDTSFIPVFEKMKELQLDSHPLVYFTDLDGSFPSEEKDDTFWIVPERSKKHEVPFGEKIVLN